MSELLVEIAQWLLGLIVFVFSFLPVISTMIWGFIGNVLWGMLFGIPVLIVLFIFVTLSEIFEEKSRPLAFLFGTATWIPIALTAYLVGATASLAYLGIWFSDCHTSPWIRGLAGGFLALVIISAVAELWSEWFDGVGIRILLSAMIVIGLVAPSPIRMARLHVAFAIVSKFSEVVHGDMPDDMAGAMYIGHVTESDGWISETKPMFISFDLENLYVTLDDRRYPCEILGDEIRLDYIGDLDISLKLSPDRQRLHYQFFHGGFTSLGTLSRSRHADEFLNLLKNELN